MEMGNQFGLHTKTEALCASPGSATRAGRSGTAVSFVTADDFQYLIDKLPFVTADNFLSLIDKLPFLSRPLRVVPSAREAALEGGQEQDIDSWCADLCLAVSCSRGAAMSCYVLLVVC
jgi:hypothetical protein